MEGTCSFLLCLVDILLQSLVNNIIHCKHIMHNDSKERETVLKCYPRR